MLIDNYFEKMERKISDPKEILFYAIMHRKWDKFVEIVNSNGFFNWQNIRIEKFRDSNITIEDCLALNLDYLKYKKNQEYYDALKNIWGSEFAKLNSSNILTYSSNILTYDDKKFDFDNKKTAFDVFWAGNQPILNLSYIDKQTIPAQQVMKNGCSIVLDEVGTGKTVAGIFTIQQVIQEYIDFCNVHKINNEIRDLQILIICPYNKRNDWDSDIMRQLGRGSILIDQSDNGENIFKVSRKTNIPQIYISGNTKTQLKESLLSHNWDLVIIDECHNCFENYKSIKSKKVLLLTATPIVVSSNDIIDFNGEKGYRNLLSTILQNGGNYNVVKDINPIVKLDGNEVCTDDDIFTCNFKEDLFDNIIIKRKIEFIECERDSRRQIWYDTLRNEKDFFTAIFSDQDDYRLASKVQQIAPNTDCLINNNGKLNELVNIINNKYKEESIIIFCETVDTVDMIYEKISNFASNTLMVGKLHGNVAEIKNKSISKDNILIELQNNIRMEKENRSILITTGKSGGTGLNLGAFHTVIHYELPFSSNELEQRFGRIERADDLINLNKIGTEKTPVENRMIFLINEAVDGEMDFETNRMLYYAITKINVTVYYMPVRNTVLFYHEFMQRVKEQALDVWNDILLKGSNDGFWCNFNSVCDYLNRKEEIEVLKCRETYFKPEENIIDFVNRMVNNTYEFSDDEKEKLINFYKEYVKDNSEELNELDNKIKQYKVLIEYYLWLNDILKLWGIKDDNDSSLKSSSIIEETLAENNDVAIDEEDGNGSIEIKEDVESDNFEKNSDKLLKNIDNVLKSIREIEKNNRIVKIKDKIQNLINDINKLNPDSNDYTGVFYRNKDGKMVNKKFE